MFENIAVIDLTKFNYKSLDKALESSGISECSLDVLVASKKIGLVKVFVDKKSGMIIAYTTKKDRERVEFIADFCDRLLEIPPVVVEKKSVELCQKKVDLILDKISKDGRDSLSKRESEYLNYFSQS